jgi:hypothetical protein
LLLNVLGRVGLGGVLGVLAVSAVEVTAPDGSGSDMFFVCFETALTAGGSSLWFIYERHAERASRAQRRQEGCTIDAIPTPGNSKNRRR